MPASERASPLGKSPGSFESGFFCLLYLVFIYLILYIAPNI